MPRLGTCVDGPLRNVLTDYSAAAQAAVRKAFPVPEAGKQEVDHLLRRIQYQRRYSHVEQLLTHSVSRWFTKHGRAFEASGARSCKHRQYLSKKSMTPPVKNSRCQRANYVEYKRFRH